jgi:hypothetical protein
MESVGYLGVKVKGDIRARRMIRRPPTPMPMPRPIAAGLRPEELDEEGVSEGASVGEEAEVEEVEVEETSVDEGALVVEATSEEESSELRVGAVSTVVLVADVDIPVTGTLTAVVTSLAPPPSFTGPQAAPVALMA